MEHVQLLQLYADAVNHPIQGSWSANQEARHPACHLPRTHPRCAAVYAVHSTRNGSLARRCDARTSRSPFLFLCAQVVLSPIIFGTAGDADLFVGDFHLPVPTILNNNASSITDTVETIHVPASWCLAVPCTFYISTLAYYNINVSSRLVIQNIADPVIITDGIPVGGAVGPNDVDYYINSFALAAGDDTYAVSLTTLAGDPDLYVLLNPQNGAFAARCERSCASIVCRTSQVSDCWCS